MSASKRRGMLQRAHDVNGYRFSGHTPNMPISQPRCLSRKRQSRKRDQSMAPMCSRSCRATVLLIQIGSKRSMISPCTT
jgi:hypothetical protein